MSTWQELRKDAEDEIDLALQKVDFLDEEHQAMVRVGAAQAMGLIMVADAIRLAARP